MEPANCLNADSAFPLWDLEPLDGAFALNTSAGGIDNAVVTSVTRPWVFEYKPTTPGACGPAVLILGGGGYTSLMVGREGVQVARWLAGLNLHAFVLVHRFPNAHASAQAPLDDARRVVQILGEGGYTLDGLGVCGLSSGGHLAAALFSAYPATWTSPWIGDDKPEPYRFDFAIIGYAPISTNAAGRQVVADKPSLEPPEKQELYDAIQPDVHFASPAPPTFVVYAGNDPVVPIVNAYRLAEGITKAGGAVELHVFADAPHGFALDTVGLPVSEWMGMCERWLRQGGWVP